MDSAPWRPRNPGRGCLWRSDRAAPAMDRSFPRTLDAAGKRIGRSTRDRRACATCAPLRAKPSGRDSHRHRLIAFHEIGAHTPRLAQDLDEGVTLQDLFPHHAKLHFGKPLSDAAMNAETERHVLARPHTIDK